MRVIAGRLRGRKLLAPRGLTTRPTADRVRQALFEILGALSEANVLDLYAGTGALGIEALSRGADRVVFVETNRAALACIRRNVEALDLTTRSTVVPLPVERVGRALRGLGPFDLVFCDPPWSALDAAVGRVARLLGRGACAPGAMIVIEHPTERSVDLPAEAGLTKVDHRNWGDTGVSLFVKGAASSKSAELSDSRTPRARPT